MWNSIRFLAVIYLLVPSLSHAQDRAVELINPGFESDFDGWSVDGRGEAVSLSKETATGQGAAKITATSGLLQQAFIPQSDATFTLTVDVKGPGLIGAKVGDRLAFNRSKASKRYEILTVSFDATAGEQVVLFLGYGGKTVRYDDVRLAYDADATVSPTVERAMIARKGKALITGVPPSANFDLSGWYLSVPTDEDGNGRSDSIWENQLVAGYEDPRFFFTAPDGGMTFRVPVEGFKTSHRTKFTRSELREMLRRGDRSIKTKRDDGKPNANNWVFSSAPQSAQDAAGAIDGVMEAELSVDHVTTTGEKHEQGRVIIGQIHAKDDEPIRLYYRKLPHHTRGSIYFAHERIDEADDLYVHMIGSRRNDAAEPDNGFALGERFGYRIAVNGNQLDVTITQYGETIAHETLDITGSGYDVADDYMYFKAGVYSQNHTGHPDDFDQATFYGLSVTH